MTMSHGVERSFRLGDAFSKSFSLFGRNFISFLVLAIIANVPNYVFQWGFAHAATGDSNYWFQWGFAPAVAGDTPWVLLALPLGIVCSTIATGAITYGVVQDLRDEPVSVAEAIAIAGRRLLPMSGVALAVGILLYLGLILLVVPGVIVACMYFVAAPVCIAERTGVGASLRRSRFLTKGHRWQIFGAYLLILFVALIVGGVIVVAVFRLAVMIGPGGAVIGPGGATVLRNAGRAATIVQNTVQAVFGAYYAVLAAVFYYQLRVAKEGIDLAKIASVFD